MKNECGKLRSIGNPYEIRESSDGWEWRVPKKYQTPEKEAQNPYVRWFCAVKSPFTHGDFDWGDTYVRDITYQAHKRGG